MKEEQIDIYIIIEQRGNLEESKILNDKEQTDEDQCESQKALCVRIEEYEEVSIARP